MLILLPTLLNQTVGDAISNMLAIEFALAYFDYSLSDWIDRTYGPDLASKHVKIHVKDKSMFIPNVNNADRTLMSPQDIQVFIDGLVMTMRDIHNDSRCRAFVRPSGTENVLRVYAEAPTDALVDNLALTIAQHIFDNYGGIGDRPS